MSANPEAFDHLRVLAYAWIDYNGREAEGLRTHLTNAAAEWMRRSGSAEVSDREITALVDAITNWCVTSYRPRRQSSSPRRTKFDRAVEAGLLVSLADALRDAAKSGRSRPASVRSLSRLTGMSRSKVARTLASARERQGCTARKADLSPTSRSVLEVIQSTLPRDGHGVVRLTDLASTLWGNEVVGRTSIAMRRHRMKDALVEIARAELGFQVVQHGHDVALARGTYWYSHSDLDADLRDASEGGRYLHVPRTVITERCGPLWGSREGREVIAMFHVASDRMDWSDVQVLFEACDLTLNPSAALHVLDRVFHDVSSNLDDLPSKITDASRWPHVDVLLANVLRKFARVLLEMDTIYRDYQVHLLVERVFNTTNWKDRFSAGGDLEAIRRMERLRQIASVFLCADDFHETLDAAYQKHRRGRRPSSKGQVGFIESP